MHYEASGPCSCPDCRKKMSPSEYTHQVILIPFAQEVMGEKPEDHGSDDEKKMYALYDEAMSAMQDGDFSKASQLLGDLAKMKSSYDSEDSEDSEDEQEDKPSEDEKSSDPPNTDELG